MGLVRRRHGGLLHFLHAFHTSARFYFVERGRVCGDWKRADVAWWFATLRRSTTQGFGLLPAAHAHASGCEAYDEPDKALSVVYAHSRPAARLPHSTLASSSLSKSIGSRGSSTPSAGNGRRRTALQRSEVSGQQHSQEQRILILARRPRRLASSPSPPSNARTARLRPHPVALPVRVGGLLLKRCRGRRRKHP